MSGYYGCMDFARSAVNLYNHTRVPQNDSKIINKCRAIVKHLKTCPKCKTQDNYGACLTIRDEITKTADFYDGDPEADIGAYNDDQAEYLRKHFESCDMCFNMIIQIRRVRKSKKRRYKIYPYCSICGMDLGKVFVTKPTEYGERFYHLRCIEEPLETDFKVD